MITVNPNVIWLMMYEVTEIGNEVNIKKKKMIDFTFEVVIF